MTRLEKRFDGRIPLETYLTAYVDDKPARGFTSNISETGLYLNTLPQDGVPPLTPVGIELELPGTGETLWIAGELRYDVWDDPTLMGRGVRFTAMADLHGRMLRQFCFRARRRRGQIIWS